MYVINKANTGINQIDAGINKYIQYLATINILPEGDYVLAGGSIRALLDKSRVRDLDIYILGDSFHHMKTIDTVVDKFAGYLSTIKFCNPFASFNMLNINTETVKEIMNMNKMFTERVFTEDVEQDFLAINHLEIPIQLISFCYDSHYYERTPKDIDKDERFSDIFVSSLEEVINSFDLTISKGGVSFTITNTNIIVNSIIIPHDCLIDLCTKTLRLGENDGVVPQQLCGIKRFHKLIKLGYDVDDNFYDTWRKRFEHNPHVLGLSYD